MEPIDTIEPKDTETTEEQREETSETVDPPKRFLTTIPLRDRQITVEDARVQTEKNMIPGVTPDDVFNFFWQYHMSHGGAGFYAIEALKADVEKIRDVLDILIAFHEGRVKCVRERVSGEVMAFWHKCSCKMLSDALDEFWETDYHASVMSGLGIRFQPIIQKIPKSDKIDSSSGLPYDADELKSVRTEIRDVLVKLSIEMNAASSSVIRSFLRFLKNDKGVEFTRDIYRRIYYLLDFYGHITADIKHSHEHQASTDPFSNYISSFRQKKAWDK